MLNHNEGTNIRPLKIYKKIFFSASNIIFIKAVMIYKMSVNEWSMLNMYVFY